MSNKPFIYQAPFPMGKDNTEYYLLTSDYVSVADFDGETILKVEPEALSDLQTGRVGDEARHRK